MHHLKGVLKKHVPMGQSEQPQPGAQDLPNREPPTQSQPAPVLATDQRDPQRADTNAPDASPGTLNIALVNQTKSATVYAYITGRALDKNNAIFVMEADGKSHYYPDNPSSIGTPLAKNCGILLGKPGSNVVVNIPHIAGGRIWFSIDTPLTFLLNPGPALVEPSVTNPTDPNIDVDWGFCEFTFNNDQLYANISYVDFVSLSIALHLETANSGSQDVLGMPPNGLDQVCDGLAAQARKDNQGWDKLIVQRNGRNLRALSPNLGMVGNPDLFKGYFEPYIDQVWDKFLSKELAVDTQAQFGKVSAKVAHSNKLVFQGPKFSKPSTHDIFTCSTGPFATGSDPQTNAIIPRLSAAFNRSTLLKTEEFPEPHDIYYQEHVTNHYSRICHDANVDGKGYAFPYDDVQPSGGKDQSGEVHAGDPKLFTITVGGHR